MPPPRQTPNSLTDLAAVGDWPLGRHRDIRSLSVCLARLACELDEITEAIAGERLRLAFGDLLRFSPAAAHLSIATERLEEVLFELQRYGESPWPPAAVEQRDRCAT